jgi:HSP20 family molecular chaperone IbpA
MRNGILTITLNKAEQTKTKTINKEEKELKWAL